MFTNTDAYREPALHFLKYGFYCPYPPGTLQYMEYWQEQLRRCREGYSVGGKRITGDHYFYLNFRQIKLTQIDRSKEKVVKTARKVVTFPDFWDGDYEYFHLVEKAEAEGKHLIVGKARRKGFSYKNSAITVNRYNHTRAHNTLLLAGTAEYLYPSGLMTMVADGMDFLNENTAWSKRRQAINTKDHKKASFFQKVDGVNVEKGYKSQVQALTANDNADVARGKDASLIIFEEAGAFNNLKDTYMATKPSTEDGGITTGLMIIFGTGGDMEGGTIDFENMFYDPETYNLLPVENIWDEGGAGTTCGWFFPDYMNKIGYMDKDGNSLIDRAKQAETVRRESIKKTAKDLKAYDKHITEYPFTPREAFMQVNDNILPTSTLAAWRGEIISKGLDTAMPMHGEMAQTAEGTKFTPKPSARPVSKFPHAKTDNLEGCVTMYQPPIAKGKQIPANLYVVVHDPYGVEGEGSSLAAAYVIKRVNPFSKPDDIIVASYVGRPGSMDEYNHTLFLLAEHYNAKIGFENDRGDVIGYAKRHGKLGMLMHEAEIIDKTAGINIRKLGRKYGTSMGSTQRKSQALIYLRDWLLTPRGKNENGETKLNLHYIYDVPLLDELIKYNAKGNFDRVSALLVGMFYIISMHNRSVEEAREPDAEDNSFFGREFFA